MTFGGLTRLEGDHFNLDADVKWVEVDGEHHEADVEEQTVFYSPENFETA